MAEINKVLSRNCRNPVASVYKLKFRNCRDIPIRDDIDIFMPLHHSRFLLAQMENGGLHIARKTIDNLINREKFNIINLALIYRLNQLNVLDKNSYKYYDSLSLIKYTLNRFSEIPKSTLTEETLTEIKKQPELAGFVTQLKMLEE